MMFQQWQKDALAATVASFSPDSHVLPRCVALYSATITMADPALQQRCLERVGRFRVPTETLYEVILQSYLFLGFPRMLQAAEVFHRITDSNSPNRSVRQMRPDDLTEWIERGDRLCRQIYGNKFESLQGKVHTMAPEIFQWMIIEGYGKVLSRPSLDIVNREMAVVACLMIENHQPQLRSHIMGALNIGGTEALISSIIDDLSTVAVEGSAFARTVLAKAVESS